ncbi:paramyosin-like [Ostrea edulis]|uniref:paramyosin-like n=1 Tax=Ostrea edulis TaxID=37623 RepID=UPI0024AF4F1A|nr:paramyosin-like [Ostrea edulis]
MTSSKDCENECDEDNIYCTQDVDEVDNEIFEEIKTQFGQYDKEAFILNIVGKYCEEPEQLNDIRQSLYDYAKSKIEDFPQGFLTERRQRGTGKSVTEKYASDVYYIFAFVEGIVSTSEFQREVISKHKLKHAMSQDLSQSIVGNTNEESMDTYSLPLHIMEDLMRKELLPIRESLTELKATFACELRSKTNDIRQLRAENNRLQTEISTCAEEKNRLADSTAQLKSEIKFLRQRLKSCEDANESNEEILRELRKIQRGHQNTKGSPKMHSADKQTQIVQQQKTTRHSENENTNSTKSDGEVTRIHKQTDERILMDRGVLTTFPEVNASTSRDRKESEKVENQKENFNMTKTYANALASLEGNSDNLAGTTTSFTSYTFVRNKRRTKRIVLANIKARDTTYEDVKADIEEWCENKDVNVSSIFLLAHHSARRFPTFVIRANIAEDDYEKTQDPDFWPDTISDRDWIIRNDRNTKPDRSEKL